MERRAEKPGGRRLTDRQTTILELVAAGRENKEIAFEIGISEQAVKEQVSRLLQLLAAPNRAALGDAAATRRFIGAFSIDPDWLRFLFHDAPLHICVVSGPDHVFVALNDAYRASVGVRDLIGMRYRDAFPERAESLALLDRVYATGTWVSVADLPRRFIRAASGAEEDGFVTAVLQPLPGADGKTTGVAIFSIDVTDDVRVRRDGAQAEGQRRRL